LLSGLLPTADCPYRRREWFMAGTQPVARDTFYKQVAVDGRTGLLADEFTPPEQRLAQLVLDLPALYHPWARAEGLVLWDDLQQASNIARSDQGLDQTIALHLVSPDAHTLFRLSPTLPSSAQKLRLEAVSQIGMAELTLWVDDTAVATLTAPPYEGWWQLAVGEHVAWANGRDAFGNPITSEPVPFVVHDEDSELEDEP
jgi:hypothetical protein